ncbi:hypothetical protein GCM10010517_58880 [Streptosporangium fragile]|uniref:Uncharacterized protein n=3 Tax=Actinomycetes TaxID=1760 RepID=A0ABN3W5M8_9ACTN
MAYVFLWLYAQSIRLSGLVNHVLDLVVRFAGSGRLGPLHCGMTSQDVEELIGPFHDRIMTPSPGADDPDRTSGTTWKS